MLGVCKSLEVKRTDPIAVSHVESAVGTAPGSPASCFAPLPSVFSQRLMCPISIDTSDSQSGGIGRRFFILGLTGSMPRFEQEGTHHANGKVDPQPHPKYREEESEDYDLLCRGGPCHKGQLTNHDCHTGASGQACRSYQAKCNQPQLLA